MKWLSEHHGTVILSRRFMGTEEDGMMDVYQLYLDATIGDSIWQWGMLMVPEKIKHLQKYIMEGVAVLKKKDV